MRKSGMGLGKKALLLFLGVSLLQLVIAGLVIVGVNTSSNRMLGILIAVIAAACIAAVGLGVRYLNRSVIDQIGSITGALKNISSPNGGDLTRRIVVQTGDEVGDLASAANAMLDSLQKLMKELRGSTAELAAAAIQLKQGADENARVSGEVSRAVEKVASGAVTQVAKSQQISAVMQETREGLGQVAATTTGASDAAVSTRSRAEGGAVLLQQATRDIGEVESSFRSLQQMVRSLNQKSEQVLEVIGYISEVSNQTHLLALNAAIEAARAGEHGRGFAVVAGEIRKLADQTQQSAVQIGDTLQAMSLDISSAASKFEQSSEQVYGAVSGMKRAEESFSEIVGDVSTLSSNIIEAAASIEQMSAGSESVVMSIQEIGRVTEETASFTEQVASMSQQQSSSSGAMAETADKLSEMASRLKAMAGHYRT
ncbi:methyl-accepting chemotaxis protein [Cohnella thailandensis]|uniref:Methyl-accepting chemotaxis protein n=1 Tax=Cohnella thailandensis TaxID=557557 RepID=A0A841STB4_9BACL|nr:methyl-accepting chemotaxis protein [Cohnella thailandensis]MBB6633458.1 methyl-accepting chemotaxis protein [Cohnella thailandensis]MBP1974473.1 methyl-accepting chemotaxis protein [Cohnella thailandensis]